MSYCLILKRVWFYFRFKFVTENSIDCGVDTIQKAFSRFYERKFMLPQHRVNQTAQYFANIHATYACCTFYCYSVSSNTICWKPKFTTDANIAEKLT